MKQKQLNKILDNHKLWIESKGKKGAQAYLVCANLAGANLIGANLEGANLEGVNLEAALLEGANLEGANLEDANLRCAELEGAYLEGANLEGANLEKANLFNVRLRGAKFTIEIRNIWRFQYCEITKDQLPWLALHPFFHQFYPTLTVFD